MSAAATDILQDLVDALRNGGDFAEVTLGGASSSTVVPRAQVACEGLDVFGPDDNASSQWLRLRARVRVHTRSDGSADRIARATDLCASATETLLADPYRGARCRNLPIGRATEIGRSELAPHLKRPEVEMSFAVRCHFEIEDA